MGKISEQNAICQHFTSQLLSLKPVVTICVTYFILQLVRISLFANILPCQNFPTYVIWIARGIHNH